MMGKELDLSDSRCIYELNCNFLWKFAIFSWLPSSGLGCLGQQFGDRIVLVLSWTIHNSVFKFWLLHNWIIKKDNDNQIFSSSSYSPWSKNSWLTKFSIVIREYSSTKPHSSKSLRLSSNALGTCSLISWLSIFCINSKLQNKSGSCTSI